MAKLAVFMSVPKKLIIHCPFSAREEEPVAASYDMVELGDFVGTVASKPALQGVVLSDKRTPRSRASCSKVMGIKDPTPHTTNTSAAQP